MTLSIRHLVTLFPPLLNFVKLVISSIHQCWSMISTRTYTGTILGNSSSIIVMCGSFVKYGAMQFVPRSLCGILVLTGRSSTLRSVCSRCLLLRCRWWVLLYSHDNSLFLPCPFFSCPFLLFSSLPFFLLSFLFFPSPPPYLFLSFKKFTSTFPRGTRFEEPFRSHLYCILLAYPDSSGVITVGHTSLLSHVNASINHWSLFSFCFSYLSFPSFLRED